MDSNSKIDNDTNNEQQQPKASCPQILELVLWRSATLSGSFSLYDSMKGVVPHAGRPLFILHVACGLVPVVVLSFDTPRL